MKNENWKTVRLGDVCKIQSGGTPSRSKQEYWKGGTIPWVKIGDFTGKYINKSSEFITEEGLNNSSTKLFTKGTVLYSIFATLGEVAILDIDATTNQAIAGLKIIDNEKLNTDYFYSYLKSLKDEVCQIGRGVAQSNINLSILRDFKIPLPPLEEQKHIAAVLDKCTEVIKKHKLMLEKYDTLVKSQFVEMFGDPHHNEKYPYLPVKEFTKVISGGTPNRDNSEYWNGGIIPWVKTTELQNNILSAVEEKITQKGLDESSAKLVPAGTVLVAMYGQGKTRGMTAFLNIEACTNQACACILPSDKINQAFLWQYFILSYNELRNLAKGGNQQNLNGDIIKNFPVLMPPRDLQDKYVSFVQAVDTQKSKAQKSLDKAETLYRALMQEYFGA